MSGSGNCITAKFHEDGFMYELRSDSQVRKWLRPKGDLCIDETNEVGETVRAYFDGSENDPTNLKLVVFPSGTTRTYHKNGGVKHVDLYGNRSISKAFSVRRWRKRQAAHPKTIQSSLQHMPQLYCPTSPVKEESPLQYSPTSPSYSPTSPIYYAATPEHMPSYSPITPSPIN